MELGLHLHFLTIARLLKIKNTFTRNMHATMAGGEAYLMAQLAMMFCYV